MGDATKTLDYGQRMEMDPRWEVSSTGGGFSCWSRPMTDGASYASGASWMITYGEGYAPPEKHKRSVMLSLEQNGSTVAYAKCRGVADAVELADRFMEGA